MKRFAEINSKQQFATKNKSLYLKDLLHNLKMIWVKLKDVSYDVVVIFSRENDFQPVLGTLSSSIK